MRRPAGSGAFHEHACRVDLFADEPDLFLGRGWKFRQPVRHQQLEAGVVLNALDRLSREGLEEAHPVAFFLKVEEAAGGDDPVGPFALHAGSEGCFLLLFFSMT